MPSPGWIISVQAWRDWSLQEIKIPVMETSVGRSGVRLSQIDLKGEWVAGDVLAILI